MLDAMRDHWPEYLWVGAGLGMLAAAEWSLRAQGPHTVLCAKLHHDNPSRCIFRCAYGSAQ